MRTRQRLLVGSIAAALVSLGGGCQSQGNERPASSRPSLESTTPPSRTSAPSISSTGTAVLSRRSPSIPRAAEAHTDAAAIAFAEYFITEADDAYVSADASVIRALSTPACKGCASAIRGTNELAQSGQRQEARSIAIVSSSVVGTRGKTLVLHVEIKVRRIPIVDRTGTAVAHTKSQAGVFQVGLDPAEPGWRVSEFAPVDE